MELERIALQDDYFVKRSLYPNVDFYSGIVLRALGIPVEMYTVLFAMVSEGGQGEGACKVERVGAAGSDSVRRTRAPSRAAADCPAPTPAPFPPPPYCRRARWGGWPSGRRW